MTKHVTVLTVPVYVAVVRDSKESYAKQVTEETLISI